MLNIYSVGTISITTSEQVEYKPLSSGPSTSTEPQEDTKRKEVLLEFSFFFFNE